MTIDELRSAAAVVRDATEEGENTATRIGQLFLDTVNTLCNLSTNAIKGYVVISSTSDLPTSPTTDQQMKGYLLGTMLYVWVGTGGDTLDGKYQSAQLKGEDGKTGPKGDSGVSLGEVVLVNDLTTGGEGNALSAGMGKVLNEKIKNKGDRDIVNGLVDCKEALVEETIVQSKNLLNTNDPDVLVGKYIVSTGISASSQPAWTTSGFVPVTSGDVIRFYYTGSKDAALFLHTEHVRIISYDENKVVITGSYQYDTLNTYTCPTNAKYIRIAYQHAYFNYYLEKNGDGTTPTYEPYQESFVTYKIKDLPTKVSDLENDLSYTTHTEVEQMIAQAGGIQPKPLALPNTIYGFVGVTMRLYQYNYMQYALDDVYLRVATSNNGTLFARKWQYTPTSAKTFTNTIRIFSHEMQMLNEDSYSIVIKDSSVKSSIKCLVIGDSIINAGIATQKVLDLASEHNYNITLLGTRGSGNNQHEGRGGWTAKMYVENASNPSGTVTNAFYNPTKGEFDFAYYMSQQGYSDVDCVVVNLGVNDMFSCKTDAELINAQNIFYENMDKIVASIKEYSSAIKIIINTITPCQPDQDLFGNGYYSDLQEQGAGYGVIQTVWRHRYNSYLTNIKSFNHWDKVENVYVSSWCAAIDAHHNMMPDVHPNTDGYNELGEQMYATIRALN